MRIGAADGEWDLRLRRAVLRRIEAYLDEWSSADPCPIEYAALYRRLPELKEAKICLSAAIAADRDLYPQAFHDQENGNLLNSYRSPPLYGHGREWFYEDMLAEAKEKGDDVESLADACAAYEFSSWDAKDIAEHYREVLRPRSRAQASSGPAPQPLSENLSAQWSANREAVPLPATTPESAAHGPTSQAKSLRLSEAKKVFLDYQHSRKGDRRTDEDAGLVIDFADDIQVNALTNETLYAFE